MSGEEEKYVELYAIGDGTRMVVEDKSTGFRYVRKDEQNIYPEMYRYLKEHRHKNVCAVNDYYDKHTHITVYEEYIAGVNLDELLKRHGSLKREEMIKIFLQICDGLEFLHSAVPPIVHRDLKLSNIMITVEGTVKIIDYGAAKNIEKEKDRDTVLLGTPEYAAPEQYGFAPSDERTDIYALGVVLEKLLPYPMYKSLIKKAKSIDPANRYQSIAQFRKDFLTQNGMAYGNSAGKAGIPGFRSGSTTNMILAVLGYLMIAYLTGYSYFYNTEYTTPGQKAFYPVIVLFLQLSWVDALFDWTGIYKKIPGYRSDSLMIRLASRLFCCMLSFMLIVLVLGGILMVI